MDGLAFFPVGGNLENCGATKSAVGEQHFFAEGTFPSGGDDVSGHTGEFCVATVIGTIEHERNKGGACGNDFVAKLACEIVAEGGGAHFGDGQTTGGDDEDRCAKFSRCSTQDEFGGAGHFGDAGIEEDLNFRGAAFGFEVIGDVVCGVVAEELAKSFFVVRDAMFFDQCQEIMRSKASQGGLGEVRIGGKEIFGCGVNVGEIAAATARDQNLFADAVGMFDHGYAAAAFAGFDGTEKACGTGAENQYVEGAGQMDLTIEIDEERCISRVSLG